MSELAKSIRKRWSDYDSRPMGGWMALSPLIVFLCIYLIPYGAQLLMAAGLAGVSSLSVIRYLYYPLIMGLFALGAILFRLPRKYS